MNHRRWLTCTAVAAMAFCASAVATSGYLEDAASKPAKKSSGLPEILLIGDSIRQLYCPYVAEGDALAGVMGDE